MKNDVIAIILVIAMIVSIIAVIGCVYWWIFTAANLPVSVRICLAAGWTFAALACRFVPREVARKLMNRARGGDQHRGGVVMTKCKLKPGAVIQSVDELASMLAAGWWVWFDDRAYHPSWISGWPFRLVCVYVKTGRLRQALTLNGVPHE